MTPRQWQLTGMVFTMLLGTLLHFTYDWLGHTPWAAAFSAVNESIWEHLKLLVVPVLLFSLAEYFAFGKDLPGFVPTKVYSVLVGMFVIVSVFYTYTGVLGKHFFIADIATFILGVLAAYLFSYRALENGCFSSPLAQYLGRVLLIVLLLCIFIFTFAPPKLPLFQDPITGQFGTKS